MTNFCVEMRDLFCILESVWSALMAVFLLEDVNVASEVLAV